MTSLYKPMPRTFMEAKTEFWAATQDGVVAYKELISSGSRGETRIYRIGPYDAKRALVVISGTHGVEGYAGAWCQTHWLRQFDPKTLPPDTAVYLIFALNSYGMEHYRRTDLQNMDANRNGKLPLRDDEDGNIAYAAMRYSLDPPEWTEDHASALHQYFARHPKIMREIAAGQYADSSGIFFGGTEKSHSLKALDCLFEYHLGSATDIAIVDFHTGLGAYGSAELICPWREESEEFRRASKWFSGFSVQSPVDGTSVSDAVSGDILNYAARIMLNKTVTAVAPEFGTYDPVIGFMRMLKENWYTHHAKTDEDREKLRIARAELLKYFAPADSVWENSVKTQGVAIIDRALECLAQS